VAAYWLHAVGQEPARSGQSPDRDDLLCDER